MLWYKSGLPTHACNKVKTQNGRDILICMDQEGAQGNVTTEIFLEDLRDPQPAAMAAKQPALFGVSDNTVTCGFNPDDESKPELMIHHFIERVEFQPRSDGTIRGLSIFARRGERLMTSAEVKACLDEQNPRNQPRRIDFRPPTTPYRVDFIFDGQTFRRTSQK